MTIVPIKYIYNFLGDLIEQKVEEGEPQFTASEILKIGHEIAKGLEYLHHEVYLLHGDIKSYNILISKNLSSVKVCDFGVSLPLTKSLEIDQSSPEQMYIGTQCWSAPEIIHGTLEAIFFLCLIYKTTQYYF